MSTLFRSGPFRDRAVKTVTSFAPLTYIPTTDIHEGEATLQERDGWHRMGGPHKDAEVIPRPPLLTHRSLGVDYGRGGVFSPGLRAVKNVSYNKQVPMFRTFHTDVKFPNMDPRRLEETKDTTKRAIDTEDRRRIQYYAPTYLAGGVLGLVTAKTLIGTFIQYKGIARDKISAGTTEVKISDIPEGKSKTFMFRGRPLFVRHRSAEEIARERAVPMNELRDPETDEARTPYKPEWVVMLGICTHLGCVPIAGLGAYGGYYCPCHGSHYDSAGRIRKGPAPLNLEIPTYSFVDDTTVVVGKD